MAWHGGLLFEASIARNATYTMVSATFLAVGRIASYFLMTWALPGGLVRAAKCYICHSSAFLAFMGMITTLLRIHQTLHVCIQRVSCPRFLPQAVHLDPSRAAKPYVRNGFLRFPLISTKHYVRNGFSAFLPLHSPPFSRNVALVNVPLLFFFSSCASFVSKSQKKHQWASAQSVVGPPNAMHAMVFVRAASPDQSARSGTLTRR